MIPPLCVIQARMGSKRMPGKMMLPLAGKPLIYHAWRKAVEAFGEANVVVAMPASTENDVLRNYIADSLGGLVFRWAGDESDVLGRMYFAACSMRWHPDSIICRVTPDDPLKSAKLMKAVAMGERHPVELSCEAITLQSLTLLHYGINDLDHREHLSHILSPVLPPPAPEGVWSVDDKASYEAMKAKLEAK